jgi:MoaA/NifB/PqqE/SkfB family radical SAM enzyme
LKRLTGNARRAGLNQEVPLMGMNINELVIEITRRCNIKCRHCLRGTAQAVDISNETIDKLLKGVDYISTITFTGGEPSLAVDKIEYTLKALKARRIRIGSFFVITNGKIASLDMVHVLLDFYYYSDKWERKELCGLEISEDQYHKELRYSQEEAREMYEGLVFFHPDARKRTFEISNILAEGRAKNWGASPADRNELIIGRDRDGTIRQDDGVIYINALGDLVPSCNLSYKSQEKAKWGNVHEKTIAEILRRKLDGGSSCHSFVSEDEVIVNHNDGMSEAA